MRNRAVPRLPTVIAGESRTKQAFRDECNINNIMRKFEKTGMVDHVRTVNGSYDDFTNTPVDYHDAMNIVVNAQNMFMTVPAKVRARFGNDPGAFISFVEDPANREECVKLGLAVPPAEPPAPMRVEVVNPTEGDGNSST